MPALSQLLTVLSVMGVVQTMLLSAVFFMSGQLAPQALAEVYARMGLAARTILMSLTVFPLCNFIQSVMYAKFSPKLVSPATIFAMVVVQIVLTVIIVNAKPGWQIIPATLLVAAGCLWVNKILTAGG